MSNKQEPPPKSVHELSNDSDFYIPPEEEWPPVEYFGPEPEKPMCCGQAMRYVGINYYESESPTRDLHMWMCEKCGSIEEQEAKLTEKGRVAMMEH